MHWINLSLERVAYKRGSPRANKNSLTINASMSQLGLKRFNIANGNETSPRGKPVRDGFKLSGGKYTGKPLRGVVIGGIEVAFGSKCEELNVRKSSPLRPTERTSMRRAATSLMGQSRLVHGSKLRSAFGHSSAQASAAHSGNPAFRSPSIISFAFDCPPRAIHEDMVKLGSSSS